MGRIFEVIIHCLPSRGSMLQPMPMTSNKGGPPTFSADITSTPDASLPSLRKGNPRRVDLSAPELCDVTLDDNYCTPAVANNAFFGSFAVNHNQDTVDIISIFQVTSSLRLAGSNKGFLFIPCIQTSQAGDSGTAVKFCVEHFLISPRCQTPECVADAPQLERRYRKLRRSCLLYAYPPPQ